MYISRSQGNNTIMNIRTCVLRVPGNYLFLYQQNWPMPVFFDSAICIHCSCSNGISWTMHA